MPLGRELSDDPRCRFVHGDFFALAASDKGFDPDATGRQFDAVLVDIDHSPEALLDEGNAAFYGEPGLKRLTVHLKPGGVFGLWSNDLPDQAFTARLGHVFADARAEPVTFHNPLQDRPFTQTVYLARNRGGARDRSVRVSPTYPTRAVSIEIEPPSMPSTGKLLPPSRCGSPARKAAADRSGVGIENGVPPELLIFHRAV